MLSAQSHELCICHDAQLTPQQWCSHQTRNNEIIAALLLKTCADKEWMIPRAPIGRRSPVAPPCDPAQPQRPCRCSLIHSREQLVYKSSASLCLWCCYAEIRFFYCSKRSVIAIRVCISSQKDIKGRWSILVILWRVPPGGNQLHLLGKRDSWSSPFPYRPSSACVVFFFFFPSFACSELLSFELLCAVSLRVRAGTSRMEIKVKSSRGVSAWCCSC